MSRTQRQFMAANMGDDYDYVVRLEDALMQACARLADAPQTYDECNTDIGWFRHLILSSSVDPKTGESPLFKDKYEENLFIDRVSTPQALSEGKPVDLTSIRAVYEKYKHLDNGLSDTHLVVGEFGGHIRYELWQAVKGICKEGAK